MPVVSVIVPAYNATATLGDTILSVRNQTFTDWELIIVDDGSQDGTFALAERHAIEDDRIRIIRRAENGGISKTRNQGISAATGRYIAFIDADDVWLPEKLEAQLQFMQENEAAISCHAYRRFSDITKPGKILRAPHRITFDTLVGNSCVGMLTSMIDREKCGDIIRFNENLTGHEDLALWLELTRQGFDILFLDRDLARYRITPGSESSVKIRAAWRTWVIYRDVANLPTAQAARAMASYGLRAVWKRVL